MEQRLIDANAIKLEKGFFEKVDNVPKFYEWLGKQPTVDAVPVVRCSECKYLNIVNGKEVYAFCGNLPTLFYQFDVDTREFYCADGERKEQSDG